MYAHSSGPAPMEYSIDGPRCHCPSRGILEREARLASCRCARMTDVLIVGGGPAGLSAALLLARCTRSVVVVDAGEPRNARARALHGFPTRDGTPPAELLALARAELARYREVELLRGRAVAARRTGEGFEVALEDGRELAGRKLVLATGVEDELPEVDGIAGLYGTTVHHCPYCDGWEHRGRRLAAYGRDARGLALELRGWSADVAWVAGGEARADRGERAELARLGVALDERRVVRLEGEDGRLSAVVFADGGRLERDALFFATGQHQRSSLALDLGAGEDEKGAVDTGEHEDCGVPGLYVAGDASAGEQMVLIAAAEGARAAIAIHRELMREERG